MDLFRDLLSYVCSYATCLYRTNIWKATWRLCLAEQTWMPSQPNDSSTPTRIQSHDLGSHIGLSACLLGVSSSPVVSKDEPYENLQTRVSERSQRAAMLSLAHPERCYFVPVYLRLIISFRSSVLSSIDRPIIVPSSGKCSSFQYVVFYDANRITGLSST